MYNETQIQDAIATLLKESRQEAHMSQADIAARLGVGKSTVQNWEAGICSPSLVKITQWFNALCVQPLPYCLRLFYPLEFSDLDATSEAEVNRALAAAVADMPIELKRKLLYILYGDHGSSPISIINMTVAHLKTPLISRLIVCRQILSMYDIAEKMGRIVGDSKIKPDIETLKKSIDAAEDAVIHRGRQYTIIPK